MLYYKNVINNEVCGLTTTIYKLNTENFYEISEEEYLALGGTIPEFNGNSEIEQNGMIRLLNSFIE